MAGLRAGPQPPGPVNPELAQPTRSACTVLSTCKHRVLRVPPLKLPAVSRGLSSKAGALPHGDGALSPCSSGRGQGDNVMSLWRYRVLTDLSRLLSWSLNVTVDAHFRCRGNRSVVDTGPVS